MPTPLTTHTRHGFGAMVGSSPAVLIAKSLLTRLACSPSTTVLLTGETGTGKALAARILHANSGRACKALVSVPCSAMPARLLERELFGHERRASADTAREPQPGLLELGDGGTVFLDEVSALTPTLQSKLVQLLEEGTFARLGGAENVHVDVRIVASTTRGLEEAVASGSFREDLFYRLQVMPIDLPPLRDRVGDITRLAAHFLGRFNVEFGRGVPRLTPGAMTLLERYPWPGNIRQLRNALERVVLMLDSDSIEPEHLDFLTVDGAPVQFRLPPHGVKLQDVERQLLVQALERAQGNYTRAGHLLGINRDQVRYRIEKFNLPVNRDIHPAGHDPLMEELPCETAPARSC
jgi:transcriptional regulator with PAS, ATPase and Fis domain